MTRRSYPVALLGFAITYYALAEIGGRLLDLGSGLSPIWLPSGVALVAVFIFGYRLWPGVTLAAFAFTLQNLLDSDTSVYIAVIAATLVAAAKSAEAVAGAYLLKRLAAGINPVGQARDFLKFVFLAAFAATALAGIFDALALTATGVESWSDFPALWLYRWAGSQTSVLIIAPLILAWYAEPHLSRRLFPVVEAFFSMSIIAVSLQFILSRSNAGATGPDNPPEVGLLIPLFIASLIWAAIRLGPRGVTSAIFLTWMIAIVNTSAGIGTLVLGTPAETFLMVHASWTSLALVIMIPGAAIAEGKESARKLAMTTGELEVKAADLSGANAELHLAIEERRQAEEKERSQRKRYEALLTAQSELGQGLTMVDLDGQGILFANEAFCRMSGFSEDELRQLPSFFSMVPAELHESFIAELQARLSGAAVADHMQTRMLTKEGGTVDIEVGVQEIVDGGSRQVIAITRDISERMLAEEALRQSEQKYRTLFEESQDAICTFDADGRILEINPAGLELFGYASREEMRRIDPTTAFFQSAGDRNDFFSALGERGFVKEYELALKTSNGSEVVLDITANTVLDAGGEIASVRGIMHDVTEHRRLEQQLIQAQKMESIGRLAGGVAHDLNNFLTGVMGYIDLATRQARTGDRIWEELKGARKAADHAADLTRQLLLFSRREVPALRPVELNGMVEGLTRMLARVIGENYHMKLDLSDGIGTVSADPGHMEQVLMNLVVNARDAMPGGGEIHICTDRFFLDESHERCLAGMPAGEYDRLSVRDTGTGMDAQVLQQIFEPFFTTKGLGKGTGLGLSVVFGIVTQHGGWVEVDSVPGEGSRFDICLPAIFNEARQEASQDLPLDLLQGNGEKILVVEDEEMLRQLARRMLAENGYEVVAAADAEEAETLFEQHADDIRLVFSDVVLPGEDGIRLINRLQKLRPAVKVLFASGYSNEEQLLTIRQARHRFIPKPYVLPQLLTTLRELLKNGDSVAQDVTGQDVNQPGHPCRSIRQDARLPGDFPR